MGNWLPILPAWEVTLRLALSLSAVLGSCPLLTSSWAKAGDAAGDAAGALLCSAKYSRPLATLCKSKISMAEWDTEAGRVSLLSQGCEHHSSCFLPILQKSLRQTLSCKDKGSLTSSPPVTTAESTAVHRVFEALERTHLELGTSSSLCRGSGMWHAQSEASKNV